MEGDRGGRQDLVGGTKGKGKTSQDQGRAPRARKSPAWGEKGRVLSLRFPDTEKEGKRHEAVRGRSAYKKEGAGDS